MITVSPQPFEDKFQCISSLFDLDDLDVITTLLLIYFDHITADIDLFIIDI